MHPHIQTLSFAEKLWHVASNPNAASFAYDRLEVCRLAAEVQMRRIWEAAAVLDGLPQPKPGASFAEMRAYVEQGGRQMRPLLFEVHYYFVAWSNCGNMLRLITGLPEFLEAKKVFDSYRKHFEHYTAARNSFEHFHDRLPGQSEESKVREVVQGPGASPSRIYFGVGDGKFRHSDLEWDIMPSSLALLKAAIDRTSAPLHATVESLISSRFGPVPPIPPNAA